MCADLQLPPAVDDFPAPSPRRRLVLGGLGAAALTAAASLWTAMIGRFLVPNVTSEPSARFRAGRLADYARGKVETKYRESHGLWIVHGEVDGRWQLYALRTQCTHLGCVTVWQEAQRRFKCPCHGSGFACDGTNVEGPAPRPLERVAVRVIAGDQLEVDRRQTFRRELGQWRNPSSFVEMGQDAAEQRVNRGRVFL